MDLNSNVDNSLEDPFENLEQLQKITKEYGSELRRLKQVIEPLKLQKRLLKQKISKLNEEYTLRGEKTRTLLGVKEKVSRIHLHEAIIRYAFNNNLVCPWDQSVLLLDETLYSISNPDTTAPQSAHGPLNEFPELYTIKMNDEMIDSMHIFNATNATLEEKGFNRKMAVSNQLCDFLKVRRGTKISRSDAIKGITSYVRENNLQNPVDRREIIPDEQLTNLLSLTFEKLDFYNLHKYVKRHFVSPTVGETTDKYLNCDDVLTYRNFYLNVGQWKKENLIDAESLKYIAIDFQSRPPSEYNPLGGPLYREALQRFSKNLKAEKAINANAVV